MPSLAMILWRLIAEWLLAKWLPSHRELSKTAENTQAPRPLCRSIMSGVLCVGKRGRDYPSPGRR